MNYRKDCDGPRNMMDDALLRQILDDMHQEETVCTSRCEKEHSHPHVTESTSFTPPTCIGTPSQAAANTVRTGCGCKGNTRNDTANTNITRGGCGCRGNARNDNPGCGCSRMTRNVPSWTPDTDNGGCCTSGPSVPKLQSFPLVMVYSPNQEWTGILDPEEALQRGTLFTELHFPWYPSGCNDKKDCGRCSGGQSV